MARILTKAWMEAVKTEGTPERAAAIEYLMAREARYREQAGIEGLRKHDRGHDPSNRHNRLPLFSHLDPETKKIASQLLARYVEKNKHKWSSPTWNKKYASLVGLATKFAKFKVAHPDILFSKYHWLKNRYAKKLKVLLGWAEKSPKGIEMTRRKKERMSQYAKYKDHKAYPTYPTVE